jgi:hypothetical protein
MKGLPIAVIPQGHTVQIWFSSPTGDSSDSFQMNIPCHNNEQARAIAAEYRNLMTAQESLANANLKIQSLTATLITHYDKSWFDQTVGI